MRLLYTGELIGANPMPLIGRPEVAKSLPKSFGQGTVADLLRAIDATTRHLGAPTGLSATAPLC